MKLSKFDEISDKLYAILQELDETQDLIKKVYPKGKFGTYKWQRLHDAICSIRDCVGA